MIIIVNWLSKKILMIWSSINRQREREREILMKCCGLSSYLWVMSSHLTLTSRKKKLQHPRTYFLGVYLGYNNNPVFAVFCFRVCALFYLVQELLLGADRILLHLHDNHFSITFFWLIEQDLILLVDDDVPGSSRTRQMFGSDNNNRMLLSPLTFNHNTDTVLLDDLQTHQQQQSVAPPNSTSTNPLCMLNQCKLACFLQLGILWWVGFLFLQPNFFFKKQSIFWFSAVFCCDWVDFHAFSSRFHQWAFSIDLLKR